MFRNKKAILKSTSLCYVQELLKSMAIINSSVSTSNPLSTQLSYTSKKIENRFSLNFLSSFIILKKRDIHVTRYFKFVKSNYTPKQCIKKNVHTSTCFTFMLIVFHMSEHTHETRHLRLECYKIFHPAKKKQNTTQRIKSKQI